MGSIANWEGRVFSFNLLCSRRVTGMVLFSLPVFSASITFTNAPAYDIDGSIGSSTGSAPGTVTLPALNP
jgi:hypothetical protein